MSREYVLQPFRTGIDFQIDYAKELNPQQHAAVTAPPGPSLVIAGAGAGKTRTLIYRVAFLLEQGIPPDRMLLLTFTNKAAREMMRRVADLLGSDLAALWGGTFHGMGHRILRRHAEQLGLRRDFTILDREDAVDLLKACLGDAKIDVAATRFPKAEVLAEVISLSANTCQPVPAVVEQQYQYFEALTAEIEDLAKRYAERKRAANVVDFDDLQIFWLRLLHEQPDLREQYQRRFQFLLVDEYQDTNRIQADIIDLLAERHHNVMVVGDDSQSIYSWRGANFRNILQFPERYPEAKVYRIETNYRSTPEILKVANAAIKANVHQFTKELVAVRRSGIKPVLVVSQTGHEQATFVAQRLLELREEGGALERMAVLYRSHFHALELQLELTRRNIPFSITSGMRFFEQAHLKDVTAYLKLIYNPREEIAFKRLARLRPGIGGKSADKLWKLFQEQTVRLTPGAKGPDAAGGTETAGAVSVPAAAAACGRSHPLASALQACGCAVPNKAATAWAEFAITVSQLEEEPVRTRPEKMIGLVLEAGYDEYLRENYPNYRARLDDLEQLAEFALQFKGTEDFLAQLSLLSNLEAEGDGVAPQDSERVRLSTIHQAKGLEFDVVFMIMLCDGLFPSARSLEVAEDEEEERRLFYVAITRARNELYLSYPLIRTVRGYGSDAMQQPSRFLEEIPAELLDQWQLRSFGGHDGSEP